jgi:hypothetical protein
VLPVAVVVRVWIDLRGFDGMILQRFRFQVEELNDQI